ncbi:MAG: hypothetical protein NDI62_01975 [Burkholderiales bacterium]|nr:hypothetical protein [Burkholderiales bacterium]
MEYKNEKRICQNCKCDFTIEPEDFKFYEKIKVPPPTFCPECRMIRRMTFRNERVFHKNKCALCGKGIISMYRQDFEAKIYCDKCWWGDDWNAQDYFLEYDWNKPFFEQWISLVKKVPLIQLWKFNNINSDYINFSTDDKNCYLSSSILDCENVDYSYALDKSQNVLDSLFCNKLIWCYENTDSVNNYNSIFLENCNGCIDSAFLFDCSNCQDCFLSSNLRNKKYMIRNVQYSKGEYEEKKSNFIIGDFRSLSTLLKEFNKIKKENTLHKYIQTLNSVNYSGNNIENSKNALFSFNVNNSQDVKYVIRSAGNKDTMDMFGGVQTESSYEGVAPSFKGSGSLFGMTNRASHDIKYSFLSISSHDLFGCVALRNKQYCILNKQYTKEEYEELIPKIIQHMNDMPYIDSKGRIYRYGEFFPPELSPFAYNETIAQEYFPLTKEEAIKEGYKWKDKEERNYNIDIKTEDIPNDIKDVDDSILNKVIECEHKECNHQCTEAFKIIPNELQFYKRMNLPIPHLCPNCRHYNRLSQRNPLKLWHRKCMKENCTNEFETSYSPDRPEIVYCEKCYNGEVY